MLGPEPRNRMTGISEDGPIVFYSPSLNTCVSVHAVILKGRRSVAPYSEYESRTVSLEDLLTGVPIESQEFDLKVPGQFKAANTFLRDEVRRYGGPFVPNCTP